MMPSIIRILAAMPTASPLPRCLSGVLALVAGIGLALQWVVAIDYFGGWWPATSALLMFFTILTNLQLLVVFGATALGARWAMRPGLRGWVVLSIVLVGTVAWALSLGQAANGSLAGVVDTLLHVATPLLSAICWLALPHGGLRWRHPGYWSVALALYLAYALWRGSHGTFYPYPFIDLGALPPTTVALNVACIGGVFLLAGFALVGLDRTLAARIPK